MECRSEKKISENKWKEKGGEICRWVHWNGKERTAEKIELKSSPFIVDSDNETNKKYFDYHNLFNHSFWYDKQVEDRLNVDNMSLFGGGGQVYIIKDNEGKQGLKKGELVKY